jgi:hypothetical protein
MSVLLDAESQVYPRELLEECNSVLLAFCSGRMGAADGHWVRQAGIKDVTCLDWDEKTLEPFRAEYPSEWTYVQADAFQWAEDKAWGNSEAFQWDLVSADMPSQYADRMVDSLSLWCALARRYVVATLMESLLLAAATRLPTGWRAREVLKRNEHEDGRVWCWLVLERA